MKFQNNCNFLILFVGDEGNADNEVQRTMLQIVTELDGFDARGNIKVLMATNRPDTLDPALLRPGRLDRKVSYKYTYIYIYRLVHMFIIVFMFVCLFVCFFIFYLIMN